MGTSEVEDTPAQLKAELARVERHTLDAMERLNESSQLLHEQIKLTQELAQRVEECERRLLYLLPQPTNCPRCKRKVNEGARHCPTCGHRW